MATAARTPTTGQPVQVNTGSQVADIGALLSALFGKSTTQTATSNPGDTAALTQLMAQLQGADYNATLQSIFQQASGQIPGLQAAYGNAIGARSGGNTAVQAALNELLKQTSVAGAKQVSDMQLQNQQIQAQTGGAIANATKGTTQTQTTKSPGQAAELASIIALTQAALKLTGSKDLSELGQKFGLGTAGAGTTGGQATTPAQGQTMPAQQSQAPVMSAAMPQNLINAMPVFQTPGMGSMEWTGGQTLQPGFLDFSNQFAFGANELAANTGADPLDALIQFTGGFGTAPDYVAPGTDTGLSFDANDWEQYF